MVLPIINALQEVAKCQIRKASALLWSQRETALMLSTQKKPKRTFDKTTIFGT